MRPSPHHNKHRHMLGHHPSALIHFSALWDGSNLKVTVVCVWKCATTLCRIVVLPKMFEQLLEADVLRGEDHPHHLGVACQTLGGITKWY